MLDATIASCLIQMKDTDDSHSSCDVANSSLPSAAAKARPRVGIVVPASNTTCESELNRLSGGRCSFHTSRMDTPVGSTTVDADAFYSKALLKPAHELALCDVKIAAFACTAAAMAMTPARLRETFEHWPLEDLVLVSTAVVAALKQVGAKKIALYTPYTAVGNRAIAAFLAANDINTVKSLGLGLNTSPEAFRAVSRLSKDFLISSVREMDRSGADCIFLSCTDMPTLEVIDALEDDFRLPVISPNLALFWAIQSAAGLTGLGGIGTLLRDMSAR